MADFQFFIPLSKLDKASRTVSGYASTPAKDSDGEIVTLDAIKAALPDYMQWGNIREMHQLKAVGTAQEANIDTKGLFLTAKIVDEAAWEKCVSGVYKGFSIGGRKTDKKGNKITGIDMTEISVVDRPANPECSFALAKSAKSAALENSEGFLVKAKKSPEQKAVNLMAKVVSAMTKAGPPAAHDGFSLPAKPSEPGVDPVDDVATTGKAEGDGPCEAHGKLNCEKCAAAKGEKPGAKGPEGQERVFVPEKSDDDEKETDKKKKKKKDAAKAFMPTDLRKLNLGAEPAAEPDFLTLRKAKTQAKSGKALAKGMGAVGTLSYVFDSIRNAQRSLMVEGKREGGDMKDKALAATLGEIAEKLASVIGQKAAHEGAEARSLTDADDQYLVGIFGEEFGMTVQGDALARAMGGDPIAIALVDMMKKASAPSFGDMVGKASDEVKEARKAMKECRKAIADCHKMHKAAYVAKMQKAAKAKKKPEDDDDDDEFDHQGAMEKLNKAFGEAEKARTFGKAALAKMAGVASRAGQQGQEAGDAVRGFYEVPPGVKDLSPSDMATAAMNGVGSVPSEYPGDGSVYAGKTAGSGTLAKYAKNGVISAEVAELLMQKAQADGELEMFRRMPSGGRKPLSFDPRAAFGDDIMGKSAGSADLSKTIFAGVDVAAMNGADERAHTAASARAIGNFLTAGQFGKSVFDPAFAGAAGAKSD